MAVCPVLCPAPPSTCLPLPGPIRQGQPVWRGALPSRGPRPADRGEGALPDRLSETSCDHAVLHKKPLSCPPVCVCVCFILYQTTSPAPSTRRHTILPPSALQEAEVVKHRPEKTLLFLFFRRTRKHLKRPSVSHYITLY